MRAISSGNALQLKYNSYDFPTSYPGLSNGERVLVTELPEFLWAAVTVGRANMMDVLTHGIHSEYEIIYRLSMVLANLTVKGRHLIKSSAFNRLDPSEKGAISYFLGLTSCKLLSQELLDTPWLLHIDVYAAQFAAAGHAFAFGSSRKRPDMIGLNMPGRWIVMESKGRTNSLQHSRPLLEDGKKQTQNLRLIGNILPILRVAAVTHFTEGNLTVDWADPEGYDMDNFFDLETTPEEHLTHYYKLVFDVLANNETTEIDEYRIYNFRQMDLSIGLSSHIYNAYNNKRLRSVQKQERRRNFELKGFRGQVFYAGADGIIIGIGQDLRRLLRSDEKFFT